MKQQVQEAGIRKWYGDDFINLQNELMDAIEGIVSDYGNCILSGATLVDNGDNTKTIKEGIAFLTDSGGNNGYLCRIPEQTIPSANFPVYIYRAGKSMADVPAYGRQYKDGVTRNVMIEYYGLVRTTAPAHPHYLTMTATGTVKRFRDAIQNASFRFATDAEKITWNNMFPSASFTGTNILNTLLTALSAANRFVTDAEKGTWNTMLPATTFTGAEILTRLQTALNATNRFITDVERTDWNAKLAASLYTGAEIKSRLDTALDATHRFATDAEKTTWNAKMAATKAAVEAVLTGTIASHTHANATTGAAGLMSGADKAKLDKINYGSYSVTMSATTTEYTVTHNLNLTANGYFVGLSIQTAYPEAVYMVVWVGTRSTNSFTFWARQTSGTARSISVIWSIVVS